MRSKLPRNNLFPTFYIQFEGNFVYIKFHSELLYRGHGQSYSFITNLTHYLYALFQQIRIQNIFFIHFFFIWKLCREFKYQAQKLTPYATSCWGRKGVPQWTVLLFLTFEQPTANGLTGHGLEKFQGSFRGSHWPKLLDFVQKLFLTEQAIR